jgi:hypothetical protein
MRLSPLRFSGLPIALCLSSLAVSFACAQKPLTPDQQALFDRVRAASYHPGRIILSCDGTIDFTAVLKAMGGPTDTDGARALADLHFHLTTAEGAPTAIKFNWQPTKIPNDVKSQVEAAATQVLDGFFKIYWPAANASSLPTPMNEPIFTKGSDGSMTVSSHTGADTSMITIGSDALIHTVVTHTVLSAQDSNVTLNYKVPPNAQPGELPRLASIDANQTVSNGMPVHPVITWDDQDVGSVHVPHKITLSIQSIFEVPTTLSACTVTPKQ